VGAGEAGRPDEHDEQEYGGGFRARGQPRRARETGDEKDFHPQLS
jgi:hypothetical protein